MPTDYTRSLDLKRFRILIDGWRSIGQKFIRNLRIPEERSSFCDFAADSPHKKPTACSFSLLSLLSKNQNMLQLAILRNNIELVKERLGIKNFKEPQLVDQ